MGAVFSDRQAITATGSWRLTDLSGHTAPRNLYIGCAGWSLPRAAITDFPADGTNLERYASVFRSVEINSSFHRPHRTSTYERWAASVPEPFRFSVKMPKIITHAKRLADADDLLAQFLDEVSGLGARLGCLLVQLPPSAELDFEIATKFLESLRSRHSGDVFIEPRHPSWFVPAAGKLLKDFQVGRVAADPAILPAAAGPGGLAGKVYFRLHGSPQIYYSSYTTSYLDGLAFRLRAHAHAGSRVWCVFDNTIRGAATENALYLAKRVALGERGAARR